MIFYRKCHDVAKHALSVGISVVPAREDGSKGPLAEVPPRNCEEPECLDVRQAGGKSWKHRQHRRASEAAIRRWYEDERRTGLCFVCGKISNGLFLFEFEGRAMDDGTFDEFLDLAEQSGQADLVDRFRSGYEEESPSGGRHWLGYTDEPVTERLASAEIDGDWRPLIETKGEGGVVVVAPSGGSVHPSGGAWKLLHGGLDRIPYFSADELDSICELARQFDEKPRKEAKPSGRGSRSASRLSTEFNDSVEWNDILEPHGWVYLLTTTDDRDHWCRPGKNPSSGTSATITPDGVFLWVFSTSTPFDANKAYSKFAAYAVLNHSLADGSVDWSAAGREIMAPGSVGPRSRSAKGEPVTVCLADVEPEHVEFMWEDRIPWGKVTLSTGDPGQGKSATLFDLAARLSSGKKMPLTGIRHEPASVIILTAEDGLGDTVAPRLLAAGADLAKIHSIIAYRGKDGYESPLSLPEHVDILRKEVERTGARLVIIDPLNAFLTGKADSHRDHHVRQALHPLTKMAEDTGVAILIISHLNKGSGGNATYRIGGSIGVVAAARAALLVATDPTDPDRKIVAVSKSNLAAFPQSVVFRLEDDPEYAAVRVKWEGLSPIMANDLLSAGQGGRTHPERDAAEDFLEDLLSDGAVPVNEIKEAAKEQGIAETTLQRAKDALGVNSVRSGFGKGGGWLWTLERGDLTNDEDTQD